jgi:hypothetical protein
VEHQRRRRRVRAFVATPGTTNAAAAETSDGSAAATTTGPSASPKATGTHPMTAAMWSFTIAVVALALIWATAH